MVGILMRPSKNSWLDEHGTTLKSNEAEGSKFEAHNRTKNLFDYKYFVDLIMQLRKFYSPLLDLSDILMFKTSSSDCY